MSEPGTGTPPVALERDENGKIRLPQIVHDAFSRGYSAIPLGADKVPLVEWKEFQERQPSPQEVKEWICSLHDSIFGWARVTGQRAGVIVLDFDGDAASKIEEWGLRPHVRTGSGGFHVILKHPGWYVKTCNSRSSKKHWELYPGIDIRGDGGYSLIAGFSQKGGYTWLRDPGDIDDLDVLPPEAREFFGLHEPPREAEPASRDTSTLKLPVPREGPDPEYLVARALEEAKASGRNNAGVWLVCQLRDHGYSREEILEIGNSYVSQCPPTNWRGEQDEYTIEEFHRTVQSILSRPPRERWGVESESVSFGDLAEELGASGANGKSDSTSINIYDYLVPSQIGARQQYPPWAIEDFLRVGNRGVLYGISGAAKSYALVDLSRAAVTGGTWLGRKVRQGSVIYIAAEDYLGIHHRVEVAIAHGTIERQHWVLVFERALALTNPRDVGFLKMAMDLLPEKPAFIVIDNLSLCMGDGDPNEGTDAKRFIDGCQALQSYRWREKDPDPEVRATDEAQITVVIAHHTNKLGNFNGSQYFENFVDAMSELTWERKGIVRTLYSRKQRHGERHQPLAFELMEVEPVDHLCVVRSKVLPPATTDAERARRKLRPMELAILDCLREAEVQRNLAVLQQEFREEGLERGEITLRSKVAGSTICRGINSLKTAGLIEPVMVLDENGKRVKSNPERFRLTEHGKAVSENPEDWVGDWYQLPVAK